MNVNIVLYKMKFYFKIIRKSKKTFDIKKLVIKLCQSGD